MRGMIVLALETVAPVVQVGLFDDTLLLKGARQSTGGRHAGALAPLVQRVLQDAQRRPSEVGLIAVDRGPGPFSAVRVGLATALGLGFGWKVPVVGVSSLALLARGARGQDTVVSVLPAYRGELFVAAHRKGHAQGDLEVEEVAPPAHVSPKDLEGWLMALPCPRGSVVGVGWDGLPGAEDAIRGAAWGLSSGPQYPQLGDLVAMALARWQEAQGEDALTVDVEPLYVRPTDAAALPSR